MDNVEREDTLLALMRQSERSGDNSHADDLAEQTRFPVHRLEEILDSLTADGDVIRTGDGGYRLSEQGLLAAETVMRRHHILESFLQEMLGLDHKKAHEEADTLEHHTSDDTVSRLRTFLKGTRDCTMPCPGHHRTGSCRTLADCAPGENAVIEGIRGCGRAMRLADLGLVPGEVVVIRQRMADTMLVRVKDCDIAISPEIARAVLVGVEE